MDGVKFSYKRAAILYVVSAFLLSGCSNGNKENISSDTQAVEAVAAEKILQGSNGEETTIESTQETGNVEEMQTTGESVSASAQPESIDYVSFLFAGDVCLEEDGFVLDHYDEIGGDLTQCMSPYLIEMMNSVDIFMLNHEYSISDRGSRIDKYYTFRANPSRMSILKQMGVDIVSLANNHVYDYGYDAFEDTIRLLDENGIRSVGAGLNAGEAEKVQYFDIKGMRIGIVSASRAEKYVITPKATDSQAGVFWMYDDTRLKEVAAEAAEQCDYLIAYLHWGTEDSCYFEDYQHDIALELVDCGVDAIIGGHPHVVQGMEYIGGVPVFYSLGDFWFNGEDKYSMMVQLNIYNDGSTEVEIIPCRQKDYCINYIDTPEGQEDFFHYLSGLSRGVVFE